MPSDQSKIIELRTKFTYSPLGERIKQFQALKPSKAEENKEDIKTIERFFWKDIWTNEFKNETYKSKKWGEKTKI